MYVYVYMYMHMSMSMSMYMYIKAHSDLRIQSRVPRSLLRWGVRGFGGLRALGAALRPFVGLGLSASDFGSSFRLRQAMDCTSAKVCIQHVGSNCFRTSKWNKMPGVVGLLLLLHYSLSAGWLKCRTTRCENHVKCFSSSCQVHVSSRDWAHNLSGPCRLTHDLDHHSGAVSEAYDHITKQLVDRSHRIRLSGLAKTMFQLQQRAETESFLTFEGTGNRYAFPSQPQPH